MLYLIGRFPMALCPGVSGMWHQSRWCPCHADRERSLTAVKCTHQKVISKYKYLEPQTSIYKWLFQLDDSKSLHREWLFQQTSNKKLLFGVPGNRKHPQVQSASVNYKLWLRSIAQQNTLFEGVLLMDLSFVLSVGCGCRSFWCLRSWWASYSGWSAPWNCHWWSRSGGTTLRIFGNPLPTFVTFLAFKLQDSKQDMG